MLLIYNRGNLAPVQTGVSKNGAPFSATTRPTYRCSNETKKRNPLKFAGVPQTPEPISAVSEPKFTILSGRVEEVLPFNKLFSERELTITFAICYRPSVCRLSVVCLSSVTFVRPTQAVEIFGNISTALGTLAIH